MQDQMVAMRRALKDEDSVECFAGSRNEMLERMQTNLHYVHMRNFDVMDLAVTVQKLDHLRVVDGGEVFASTYGCFVENGHPCAKAIDRQINILVSMDAFKSMTKNYAAKERNELTRKLNSTREHGSVSDDQHINLYGVCLVFGCLGASLLIATLFWVGELCVREENGTDG